MSNKLFSKDDPAALAYEAAQRDAAGYEDEAWMIEHEPTLLYIVNEFVHRFIEHRDQRAADAWLALGALAQIIR
jgi:hypothetical protein